MTKFGDELIAALGEALAHARGDASEVVVHQVDLVRDADDVKAIRRRVGLKQAEMARIMNLSLSGYRKWEQSVRSVSGPARTLLTILDREPEAVLRAMAPELRVGAGEQVLAGSGTAATSQKNAVKRASGKRNREEDGGERSARHRGARKAGYARSAS
jgi:putative transcriptional regulator